MGKYNAKKEKSSWYQASVDSIEAAEDGSERWQSRTWEFTRLLKGQYPEASAGEIMNLIPWQETEFDEDDQAIFMDEWNRFIPGMGEPLDWAWQKAQERLFDPPKSSPYSRFPSYGKLLTLGAWLQGWVGEENTIFLPTRRVSKMLDLKSHTTVAALCRFAVEDGLMELVEKHTRKRSARYRFRRLPRIVNEWIAQRSNVNETQGD